MWKQQRERPKQPWCPLRDVRSQVAEVAVKHAEGETLTNRHPGSLSGEVRNEKESNLTSMLFLPPMSCGGDRCAWHKMVPGPCHHERMKARRR